MTRDELISMMQDVLAGPDADAPDYLVAYDDAVKLHAAIEAAGLCIVPREPDDAILTAGVTQSVSYPVCPPGMTIEPLHQFTLTCCYRAMIEAGRI